MEHGESWFGGYTVDAETDGIHAAVGIDVESLPLPAIKVRVESRRDDRVGVVLHHDVPDDPGIDAVGFHPEFGAEGWTVYESGRLAWTGILDPGETVTTLYGVWLTAPREIFGFLDAPTIGRVDPVSRGEKYDPGESGTGNKRLIDDSLAESGPASLDEMTESVRALLSAGEDATESSASAPDAAPSLPSGADSEATDADGTDGVPDGAVRAGRAELSRPDPAEVAALDDGEPTRGRALFVRLLVADRAVDAPALLQELVTAVRVRGRRVVARAETVRVDAVVDADHDPRDLADALADREAVVDALVQAVDRSSGSAPSAETTEFDVLKRDVEAASVDEIEAELDGGRDAGPSVAELVGAAQVAEPAPPADPDGEAPSGETVRALVEELRLLRGRVDELESEVSELRVRNRRLEQLYEREREESRTRRG